MAKDNKSLGKFQLTGIPPAPRGVPQIEVSFEIDADGILQVAARDKGTGRAQSIRITNTGGLSKDEVERMRLDAEDYADEDERRRQLADLVNQADNLFYSYESTMRDNSELIDPVLKASAEEKAAELRAAMQDKGIAIEDLSSAMEGLQQALFSIGSTLYRQTDNPDDGVDFNVDVPDEAIAETIAQSSEASVAEEPDANIDLDVTITADYEAID